jgi:ABC transporter substrate binding protein (PQQ-dependent alcohol dehydrogenase system)
MTNFPKRLRYSLLGLLLAVSTPLLSAKSKPKVVMPTKTVAATKIQPIEIVYFSQQSSPPAALSNLDPFIANQGLPGAELAIQDNNTTGEFIHQAYHLTPIIVPEQGHIARIFSEKITASMPFVLVNLPAAQINQLADLAQARQKLLFDVSSSDDSLRNQQCRANVLHLLPSRAMRADALAQLMLKKRWTKWFLVVGNRPEDKLYAQAIQRAAKRFGLKIVAEKAWQHTFDARRNEQSEVAVFTQGIDYDVLILADEQGLFGEYVDYRTWLPRPVIGTQGLIATAWHSTHEQWGAIQIQNRFTEHAGRKMTEIDYGAYLAVRAIGEAAVRTQSNQLVAIKNYLLSPQFALQGYKGNPLSFRAWDGQLRQPILLAAPRSLVAVAPIEGFLHPKTELDTLGFDQPESDCKAKFSSN